MSSKQGLQRQGAALPIRSSSTKVAGGLSSLHVQALEKLSSEHAQACLRHGALLAVLSYLDFFQTSVQRVAVATAAHMCRGITTENTEAIQTAVPILTNLLQYQVRLLDERSGLK